MKYYNKVIHLIWVIILLSLLNLNSTSKKTVVLIINNKNVHSTILKGRIKSWDIALNKYDLNYNYNDTVLNRYIYYNKYHVFKQTDIEKFKSKISEYEFKKLFPEAIR